MKISIIYLSILPLVSGVLSNNLYSINHNIYSGYERLGKVKQFLEPNLFSIIEHRKETAEKAMTLKEIIGNNVVKSISETLPHVDSIGHKILHANNIFINDVLNSNILDHETQKTIILFSIKIAQYGDDMGSELLQTYYNIVDYCL